MKGRWSKRAALDPEWEKATRSWAEDRGWFKVVQELDGAITVEHRRTDYPIKEMRAERRAWTERKDQRTFRFLEMCGCGLCRFRVVFVVACLTSGDTEQVRSLRERWFVTSDTVASEAAAFGLSVQFRDGRYSVALMGILGRVSGHLRARDQGLLDEELSQRMKTTGPDALVAAVETVQRVTGKAVLAFLDMHS